MTLSFSLSPILSLSLFHVVCMYMYIYIYIVESPQVAEALLQIQISENILKPENVEHVMSQAGMARNRGGGSEYGGGSGGNLNSGGGGGIRGPGGDRKQRVSSSHLAGSSSSSSTGYDTYESSAPGTYIYIYICIYL